MLIDLHTHSRHSDGTQSPAELVREAARGGLNVLALTDHDVSTGWLEAGTQAQEVGITLIPGIEISCSRRGTSVHLLGYLLDPDHPQLSGELATAREHRVHRIKVMADRLESAGYPVTFRTVVDQAGEGATLGRPHLADTLVAAGRFPDRTAAFGAVLHRSSPFYVSHYAPDPVRAVELVRAAGGVAVMAHPFAGARGAIVGDEVIEEMVAAGLDGLEVDHRDHPPPAIVRAEALCRRFGLLRTGSSDYHGTGKPNRLGEHLTTPEVLDEIIARGTGALPMGAPLKHRGSARSDAVTPAPSGLPSRSDEPESSR